MFKNVKKGDRVWDLRKGWGVVAAVYKSSSYEIEVRFDGDKNEIYSFTFDGKYMHDDMYPSLFWDQITFDIPQRPLEVNTKVIVWSDGSTIKRNRYFSKFDEDGRIRTFINGSDSWSSKSEISPDMAWDNWELATE